MRKRKRLLLKFGHGNGKVGSDIHTFSLPAGWSCPGARECLTRADARTGKIKDGPEQKFRCFAASMEARHPGVRNARWHNFEALQKAHSVGQMAALIIQSVPRRARRIRVHVSGDFFSLDYFRAWLLAAEFHPDKHFYAYTKSIQFWKALASSVPPNFELVGSLGGKYDEVFIGQPFRTAKVVFSVEEAGALPIDHDDSHAYAGTTDFALLLHGTQPKGTVAAAALKLLK